MESVNIVNLNSELLCCGYSRPLRLNPAAPGALSAFHHICRNSLRRESSQTMISQSWAFIYLHNNTVSIRFFLPTQILDWHKFFIFFFSSCISEN